MTASNPENPIAPGIASSSVTYRKDRLKSRSTLRLSRRCIFRNSWDNRSPQRTPTAIPRKIEVGTRTKSNGEKALPLASPVKDVNNTMTNTSSTEAPAIISCGIPCLTPYPSSINLSIFGTTTAGETAAITVPKIAASSRLTPKSFGASKSIPAISKDAGKKHISTAGRPTFLRSETFRFNPARVNMMMRAICRRSAEIDKSIGSSQSNT